jgi:peptidoglycan hydrolase-like protein with peptidoglycan-binding domain
MRKRHLYITVTSVLLTVALLPSNMQAARTGINLPALPRGLTPVTDPLVLRIQKVLQKIRVYRGPLDGFIGPQTLKAVRAYQKIRGLKPNNRITNDLADQLETEDKVDALLNRLKDAKAESIEVARQALLTQKAAQGLVKGSKEPEVADPTRDVAPCFQSPTPSCLLAKAAEALRAIFKPELRGWALGELLVAQAKQGLADSGMHTVRRIADPLKRANLFGKSAVIQNCIGNKTDAKETLVRAEKLALGLDETKQRETALGYIATAWAEIGDVDRAFSVLEDMGQQNERTPALISAATAQAKAGNSHLALETAQEIDSLRYKSVVLAKIVATQGTLKKGDDALRILEQARNAATEIKKPFARDYAISRIAPDTI